VPCSVSATLLDLMLLIAGKLMLLSVPSMMASSACSLEAARAYASMLSMLAAQPAG
jgi:hypothetical protein